MKKTAAILLSAALLATGVGATAMENLQGTALISEEKIYYAGSLDGVTRGVFEMDMQGGNARMIYPGDAILLSASESALLLSDYGSEEAKIVLIDKDGAPLVQAEAYADSAVCADGRFFVGTLALGIEEGTGAVEQVISMGAGEDWMFDPVCVAGGALYYLDRQKYALVSMMEGDSGICALNKLDLATGTTAKVSPEGTRFLGVDGEFIYYTRENFYIAHEDGTVEIDARPGLYCARLDDAAETLLAEMPVSADRSVRYTAVEGGVVYGLEVVFFEGEDGAKATLKRVTTRGEALQDVAVPSGALGAVKDGVVYIVEPASAAVEGDYVQDDRIIRVDTATGAQSRVNEGRTDVLFLSEADPKLSVAGDTLYYLDMDIERGAVRLNAIGTDGQNARVLGHGYTWAEGEDMEYGG